MKVTNRWKKFLLLEMMEHDLIELDGEKYVCTPHFHTSKTVIDFLEKNPAVKLYTFKEIDELKSSHPNFMAMYQLLMKVKAKCECGADSISAPGHDWYCPKRGT